MSHISQIIFTVFLAAYIGMRAYWQTKPMDKLTVGLVDFLFSRIEREEGMMEEKFGQSYREYVKGTNRPIPWTV